MSYVWHQGELRCPSTSTWLKILLDKATTDRFFWKLERRKAAERKSNGRNDRARSSQSHEVEQV